MSRAIWRKKIERIWVIVHENVNMAAWRVSIIPRFIVVFLYFYNVLGIKVSIGGTSHVCVSGSHVLHVNFGTGTIQQCGLVNTTPQASKGDTADEQKKAKEHAKAPPSQGLYASTKQNSLNYFIVGLWSMQPNKFIITISV